MYNKKTKQVIVFDKKIVYYNFTLIWTPPPKIIFRYGSKGYKWNAMKYTPTRCVYDALLSKYDRI